MNREEILAELKKPWDIIVVGGGITGAGVFREGARAGFRCLLLEQRDFAWGTSSRSGKMVHGGLRYLAQGQIKTTWHSVREREKLLREYAGMVESMGFLVPYYEFDRLTPYLLGAGLTVYDLMAFRYDHSQLDAVNFVMQIPAIDSHGLTGGVRFRDARTDDARLVLRVIQEGESLGGVALNYVKVEEVCKDKTGRVQGVALRDEVSKENVEVRGQLVINATGVWADELRSQMGRSPRMRRLRGSHLIFPSWRFPLAQALSFFHPADNRSVYVLPWEGITLVGTTDVDHEHSLAEEPHISYSEGEYLLEGVRTNFPSLNLTAKDILSTFSGVRPVINTGKANPSKESRDHVIWNDNGLVTVTGGKMTTFSFPPGSKMGFISAQAAELTGLPKGLPLIAGASDKACEVLGSGCLEPHQGCIGFGTTATICVNSKHYVEPIPLVPPYPSAKPGAYNLEFQTFRGFWMVSWFKEQFALKEQEIAQERGVATESLLEEMVAKVPPGSLGLLLQPYWSPGLRYPGPEAKGCIIGFGGVHKREHIYRALLEGLVYSMREGRERIEKRSKVPITELSVCGGGSKSDQVMQITADVFNLPVRRTKVSEASGLGAAILAAVGSGFYPDIETAAREMTNVGSVFEPNSKSVKIYDELFKKVYSKTYRRLRPLYRVIQAVTGYPEIPGKSAHLGVE